jgi:DsbC/DsbD-like thiol-disulfide interchange protein
MSYRSIVMRHVNAFRIARVSRVCVQIAAMAALCAGLCPALAGDMGTAAYEAPHTRIRLLPMSVVPVVKEKLPYIAIEIRLENGWKTYWRSPGEGIAPSFSWDESHNVKTVEVLWPAPKRFSYGEDVSLGYDRTVLLPVVVTPADPAKPVNLNLVIAYGICKDICMPVEAELSVDMDQPVMSKSDFEAFTYALRQVPKRQGGDAQCPHRFISAKLVQREGGAALRVETAFDGNAQERDLIVEAPREAGVGLAPVLDEKGDSGAAAYYFSVAADGVDALKGKPLTFTTISDLGSCESTASVE